MEGQSWNSVPSRRRFLQFAGGGLAGVALGRGAAAGRGQLALSRRPPAPEHWLVSLTRPGTAAPHKPSRRPPAPEHSLVVISGRPREQGRSYGRRFAGPIRQFLQRQILGRFGTKRLTPRRMLRYAAACLKPIRQLSPALIEHYEGMAEGSGLRLEEHVLISLHEELWHRGTLPAVNHCTAMAVGPPETADGHSYVCQSWDWYADLFGQSQMIRWRCPHGPDVISYSYPGLWMGAGINSAGIALCWTSALDKTIPGPAVGVPSYALIAHLLAQPSLRAVAEEARRARQAGWFTFVMADSDGQLVNIEGSPRKLVVEWSRGALARVYYGTRQMTGTAKGAVVKYHPQCRRMMELLRRAKGRIDRPTIEGFYSDHEAPICKHFNTLDVMIYDVTAKQAFVARGPGCLRQYRRFTFAERGRGQAAAM